MCDCHTKYVRLERPVTAFVYVSQVTLNDLKNHQAWQISSVGNSAELQSRRSWVWSPDWKAGKSHSGWPGCYINVRFFLQAYAALQMPKGVKIENIPTHFG